MTHVTWDFPFDCLPTINMGHSRNILPASQVCKSVFLSAHRFSPVDGFHRGGREGREVGNGTGPNHREIRNIRERLLAPALSSLLRWEERELVNCEALPNQGVAVS